MIKFYIFTGLQNEELELKVETAPNLERKLCLLIFNIRMRSLIFSVIYRKSFTRRRKVKNDRGKIPKAEKYVYTNS